MKNKNNEIIRLEQIYKVFKSGGSFWGSAQNDVVALNRVSLNIYRGEIFGLVGESGSGKTTDK